MATPRKHRLRNSLFLAGMAVPVYVVATSSPFSVSSLRPLGEFGAVESWLTNHGFSKRTMSSDEGEKRKLIGQRFYGFRETEKSDGDEETYLIAIGVDGGGVIRSLRAGFRSAKEAIGTPYSMTEKFVNQLWSDVGGADTEFGNRSRGHGRSAQFQHRLGLAAETSSVRADWNKHYLESAKHRSITDFVWFEAKR